MSNRNRGKEPRVTSKLLDAFIQYERSQRGQLDVHQTVGVPVGTRLQRIMRVNDYWILWVSTRDYKYGTYYTLHNDGSMFSTTARADEGDEVMLIRPSDDTIRRQT